MSNFIEPAPSPMMISLVQAMWPAYAQLKLGNLQIELAPEVLVEFNKLRGVSTILCANHPAPEDAEVMFGLSAQVGDRFIFLTARELFQQAGLLGLRWLQTLGCYSVERGTCDLEAFKATRRLLTKGNHKISIFPEGEVTYQDEFLTELENGPELIALSAVTELARSGSDKQIVILPLAIKYKYNRDIRQELEVAMHHVEKSLNFDTRADQSLRGRIQNAFDRVLSVLEESEYGTANGGASSTESLTESLTKRISAMQERMVVEVECALQMQIPRNLTLRCRIHLLGNVLSDMQWNNESGKREISSDLLATLQRKLMRALRFGAVGDSTFDHQLSQVEAAELLTTLLWETDGMLKLGRPNVAVVGAGEPIDVGQYLAEYNSNKTKAMERLKNALGEQINSRLTQLDSIHRGALID